MSLLFSSLLSLVIGTIVGLTQKRIKRLYAFSTISHVGFLLLALSIHSVESTQAFLFYLMQYSITNLNAFILIIAIGYSLYCYVYEVEDNTYKTADGNEQVKRITHDETKLNTENPEVYEENSANENQKEKENLQDINNSPLTWGYRKLPSRVLRPNYGKPLKVLIPNHRLKSVCG